MKNMLPALLLLCALAIACQNGNPAKVEVKQKTTSRLPADNAIKILEKENVEYAYPRWSNDGKQILFQSNETGLWQLYVMHADGSHIRQLTAGSANNNFADWSPDNRKISFVSDRTGNEEIFVMDASGANPKQLTKHKARDIHPYWSPDGTQIYFNSTRDDQGDFEIYVIRADGNNLQRITYTGDNETCARLSPRGDKLIYLRNNATGLDDVFVMHLADSSVNNVTRSPWQTGWPCWLPNGEEFIFSTMEHGVYKLHLGNVSTMTVRKISTPPHPYWDGRAQVSEDGKRIVFNRQKNGTKNTIGIYTMELKETGTDVSQPEVNR